MTDRNFREAKDLYEAQGCSLWEIFNSENGNVGFKIPIYQRDYDWDTENIDRLFEDCINGVLALSSNEVIFTFLGTIILTEDSEQEGSFDGKSLSVVDGQQRLTTLSLTACALLEHVVHGQKIAENITDGEILIWLQEELDTLNIGLQECAVGSLKVSGREYETYPRIVRENEGDNRAKRRSDAEYRSTIAAFLKRYDEYVNNKCEGNFDFDFSKKDSGPTKRFQSNWVRITELVNSISKGEIEEAGLSVSFPDREHFRKREFRRLLRKLKSDRSEDEANKLVEAAIKMNDLLPILRIIIFSNYFLYHIAITKVKALDERYAFDIFDALNTTGEPLTAIETFKPKVIEFEKGQDGYERSPSANEIQDIEKMINKSPNTNDRQNETKELITSFALYIEGEKLSKKLADQRRFLQNRYRNLSDPNSVQKKRRFVSSLADIARYKNMYWDEQGLKSLFPGTHNDTHKQVLLCLRFLRDLKNTLTIPILTRYYVAYTKQSTREDEFYAAVKALTAFVFLRRSVTGSTAGIDTDLRNIMYKGPKSGDGHPLKVGLDAKEAPLPPVTEFKKYLKQYLVQTKVGVSDKQPWVTKVVSQGIADASQPVSRLLLLAASHNSMPNTKEPGMLTRKNIRVSEETKYLTPERWTHDDYKTVEHIAPESNPGSGWDSDIYTTPYLRHTVGNLTLLPQKENSTVGNSSWAKKKKFYLCFSASTETELQQYIDEAKSEGITFSKKAEQLLKSGKRLPSSETIGSVDNWNADFIKDRSKNIASLAWDVIAPWLFD